MGLLPTNPIIIVGGGDEAEPVSLRLWPEGNIGFEPVPLERVEGGPVLFFRPLAPLAPGRTYVATVSGNVAYPEYRFTTVDAIDTDAPEIEELRLEPARVRGMSGGGSLLRTQWMECDNMFTRVTYSWTASEEIALVHASYFSESLEGDEIERIGNLSLGGVETDVPGERRGQAAESYGDACYSLCPPAERQDEKICARFEFFDLAGNSQSEEACAEVVVERSGGCSATGRAPAGWAGVALLLLAVANRRRTG